VLVVQTVEDAVAAKYHEVMELGFHRELRNFGLGNHHTLLASILGQLGFDVTKSATNGETTRKDSMWTKH